MRIGIITIHKIRNFGSALQAYGLQTALQKLGHETTIIDYKFPNKFNRARKHRDFRTLLRDLLNDAGLLKYINPEVKCFSEFHKLFKLTKSYTSPNSLCEKPPKFDVYMTGSDQVWNPIHTNGDTTFLLDFVPRGGKKIAYAASFACKSLSNDIACRFSSYLKEYNFVGVREHNGKILYENLTGKTATVVLDPSLLLTLEDWSKVIEGYKNPWNGKDYVLAYFLTYAYNPFPYAFQLAEYVANYFNKELICLCLEPNIAEYRNYLPNAKLVQKVGPIQFIQLFKEASFVITTSFHGTAFASNFCKPLFSIINSNSEDDRQSSFLKSIDREDAVVACGSHFEELNINQAPSLYKLEKMREKSYSFLKNSLQ